MHALLPLLCAALVAATPLEQRDTITSTVNLSNNTGSPEHLASGFIYGIPDTQDQIPDHFYTDIGFNYARAGGAQVSPNFSEHYFLLCVRFNVCTVQCLTAPGTFYS